MPGRGINMDLVRKSGITARDYLANLDPRYLECFWQKGKWRQFHGDGKAETYGAYVARSMETTTAIPEYRIQVLYLKKPMLNFTLPGSINKDGTSNPPTPQEVIDALAIELTNIGLASNLGE
ncbi:hypothetical protein N7497_007088 [Penicillium chrysogenum]|uniref:Uncharacterized protein n=1 Tax=Penicillium chrysogenum TaxID=5076 RepID=A0ABQ8W421_PENCH|nr:hypothetical protein N7505_010577 [Penicillium chrysogenum]KAJ6152769.1 hypothetical protein N7497_007088 [Penicillium chrysogenum]